MSVVESCGVWALSIRPVYNKMLETQSNQLCIIRFTCENWPYRRMTFVQIEGLVMVKSQFPFQYYLVYPKYLNA